jgi:hypothetical protein
MVDVDGGGSAAAAVGEDGGETIREQRRGESTQG